MEVEYYRAQLQNHLLAVVQLIHILSCLCGHDGGERYKCQCMITSSSSKDNIEEDPWFVVKMKYSNNGKKRLNSHLATHTITSQLSSEKSAPGFTFSKQGFYHSRRISLILLHSFAKCLIALSISTSFRSRIAYRICIQFVTAIVLHPRKTLLRLLPHLWLSLYVKFVSYMTSAFSLDTEPATSSRGTRTRARTNDWDMTKEHAFSCLCDEPKHSVDESGLLDDAKQIASKLNCSKDNVARSRKPSKPIYIFALPAHHTYNLQNLRHTLLTSATASHHPWWYIQHSQCLFRVTSIWYPPLNHWPPLRT